MEPMALGSPVGSPSGTPSSPTTSPFLPSFLMGDSAPNVSTPRTNARQQTPRHVTFGSGSFAMPSGQLPQPIGNARSLQSVMSPLPEKPTSDFGPPTMGLFDTLSPLPAASPINPLPAQVSSKLLPPSNMTPTTSSRQLAQDSALIFGSGGQKESFDAKEAGWEGAAREVPSGTWVTVFGFLPHAVNDVLAHFVHCGTILEQRRSSTKCNWLHLRFGTQREARRALGKNGKVFGGCMMVGVIPCQDMEILSSQKENIPGPEVNFPSSLQQTSDGSLSGIRPLGVDLSSPWKESPKARTSSATDPSGGIRPLMKVAATVSSPQRESQMDGSAKASGLLSKTIDFLFGQ